MVQTDTGAQLPYLTADLPGIGGAVKVRPEDFFVEEIPLYECCGEGTHVFVQIEKRGLSTPDALARIAAALGLARRHIGYAGLKDARAVTRQWISLEHIDPERLANLRLESLTVRDIRRHTNKLKMGHLAANRFVLRLRHVPIPIEAAVERAGQILAVLARRGAPNYFGPQRFGSRCDTHLLGAAIIYRHKEQFVDLFLGLPDTADRSVEFAARTLYEQGRYAEAHAAWPKSQHDRRRALQVLIKNPRNKERAFNVIDKHHKRFCISAFQSDLFNQVLAARMPDIDRLQKGDLAYLHANGACFRVTDPAAEQARCSAFEISPTGPIYGYRMTETTDEAARIEQAILQTAQLSPEDFRQMGYYRIKGTRRPLRFGPRDFEAAGGRDEHGPYVQLSFRLDPGCYATTLIRELVKTPDAAKSG